MSAKKRVRKTPVRKARGENASSGFETKIDRKVYPRAYANGEAASVN
jgi:hypothetical protein